MHSRIKFLDIRWCLRGLRLEHGFGSETWTHIYVDLKLVPCLISASPIQRDTLNNSKGAKPHEQIRNIHLDCHPRPIEILHQMLCLHLGRPKVIRSVCEDQACPPSFDGTESKVERSRRQTLNAVGSTSISQHQ